MGAKKVFFVTATNTDVGKTYACIVLLRKFAKKGYRVGYFKPIETGVEELPNDGSKLMKVAQSLNSEFTFGIDDVVPYQFKMAAAPYISKGDTQIDFDFLVNKKNELLKSCDILFIEGAGGLMVPIEKDFFMIDMIKLFDAEAILISPSNLGSINDTLLSMQALKKKKIKYKWYINLYKDKETFETITLPFYKDYFKKINYL